MKPIKGTAYLRPDMLPRRKADLRKAIFLRRPLVPEAEFTLCGQLPSGKGQQGVDPVRHHRYPNPRFAAWREATLRQLPKVRLEGPLHMNVAYYPGDDRIRDVSGILDALFHLFERGCLIWNDGQIKDVTWHAYPKDRSPGAHIRLEAVSR